MYELEAKELKAINTQIMALQERARELDKLFHSLSYTQHVLMTDYGLTESEALDVLLEAEEYPEAALPVKSAGQADILSFYCGSYTFQHSQ